MVPLPDVERAAIPPAKLRDYLLAPEHPEGRGKAAFFTRYGFRREAWPVLADALRQHAAAHGVARTEPSLFGTRWIVEGPLVTPSGRTPRLRAVWFTAPGGPAPRFVTAYPLPASDD